MITLTGDGTKGVLSFPYTRLFHQSMRVLYPIWIHPLKRRWSSTVGQEIRNNEDNKTGRQDKYVLSQTKRNDIDLKSCIFCFKNRYYPQTKLKYGYLTHYGDHSISTVILNICVVISILARTNLMSTVVFDFLRIFCFHFLCVLWSTSFEFNYCFLVSSLAND